MRTDVSGVVKSIMQVRANLKAKAPEKEAPVSFMDLMNQSSLTNMNMSVPSDQMEFQPDVKTASNTTYDAYMSPVKNVSLKEGITPEEMQEEAAGAIETYEEEIQKILQEEFGVSEEEISSAMEALGITFLDLRNLQNLTSLVQKLTGEDIGTLFSSEAFQNVVEQVTELTEALCAELGISKEELNVLCEAWEQIEHVEVPDEAAVKEALDTEDGHFPAKSTEEAMLKTENENLPGEQTAAGVKDEPAAKDLTEGIAKEQTSEQVTAPVETEKEKGSSAGEQNLFDHSKDARYDTLNAGTIFTDQQAVRTEEFILPQEGPQPYADQVDAFELIDQIARNVRVTVSEAATSMEMQLNPEHLGKIYLNVSEREGVVRAQIATQNVVVKEALETQLVELRQSLNQQGIKVDAIEVTVSAHEFEQNLEENARHEEQMRQQREESQKQARRSLNLNDLDGLSGLMSEEEQLAAQIMRDNGNQVDFTA